MNIIRFPQVKEAILNDKQEDHDGLYIAHLSKEVCILTVEVSAKFTALRFLYKRNIPAKLY